MPIVNYFILITIVLLAVPVFVFIIQVFSAAFIKNKNKLPTANHRPSISVIMPAHNEELVIEKSIKTVMPQLEQNDKLIVVADNCNDKTAIIARRLGAQVLERFNDMERGKGYAIDYGLKAIQDKPTDIVIIVDADCRVEENCLERLSLVCLATRRPVQALYLMELQPKATIKQKVAAFAWVVKNKVRPLGMHSLSFPCQLMGTGMAFLWDDIHHVDVASGHIVEDMKLGVDLARKRKPSIFLLDAVVTSIFPPNEAAVKTQRARWEHGHLSVILNETPRLIFDAFKTKNLQLLALASDLLVPPLAMLSLLTLALLIVSTLLMNRLAILLTLGLLLCLLCATFVAWVKFGRKVISFKQLCYAPVYALLKVPLYIKFFLRRQVEWVRSNRD